MNKNVYNMIDILLKKQLLLGGIYMKGKFDTDLGRVIIDEEVIKNYAGSVALGCFGIVGMAAVNMKDGLVHLLKKDYLNRGIEVFMENDSLIINFHVIVAYDVNINAISETLISTVKYQVEQFTGLTIDKINIYVEGVRVID